MAVCRPIGIKVQFMPAAPYYHNVGFRRLLNHYLLAGFFRKTARQQSELPDVVVASLPPPMLTYQAARFAKSSGIKMIVDIQDIWPEVFYSFIPNLLRPLCSIAFLPWSRKAKNAYKLADAIVGITETYIGHVTKLTGVKKVSSVVPLGLDYHLFDSVVPKGCSKEFTKPAGETWFIYAGSLTRNHDFLTLTRAFGKVQRTLGVKTRLFVAGQGALSGKLKHLIDEEELTNVTQTGFLDLNSLAYLLTQCDVGFNASWPETRIYLSYKLFYCFAAGLAVLNTMPGECSRIINQNQCGLTYKAGDINSCMQAIKEVVSDPGRLRTMQQNSHRLAQTVYDRKVLYQQYVDLIEKVAEI